MHSRNGKDIWTGLYDFYLVENTKPAKPEKAFEANTFLKSLKPKIASTEPSKTYKHILSHQTIFARFTLITLKDKPRSLPANMRFYSINKVAELPKPVLISRFLQDFRLL